jgi:hypothetical protein
MKRFKWYRKLRGGYWVKDLIGWYKITKFQYELHSTSATYMKVENYE